MFTAMILGCVFNIDTNTDYCMGFSSPILFSSLEECTEALETGIPYVEEQGWTIKNLECYDWERKKGTSL